MRDWNVTINYGIKTGYNDAFIIDKSTRQEIISKEPWSEKIIRPILRGRDIKKYGSEFRDLWIITTFPSLKIDIEQYPAIKGHLLGFGIDRLKQTGELGARKKTNNKWFETQDSISYWEDFSRQKMVWKRVGSILRFSYDDSGVMALDSTCFAVGKHLKFLLAVLNSNMGRYLMKDSPQTGTGDLLISVQAVEPLKIPIPNDKIEAKINDDIDLILRQIKNDINYKQVEEGLNNLIYKLYELEESEINFIESQ